MTFDAIHQYYQEVERLKHFGGTAKETSIRTAFQKLLDLYAKGKDLLLVAEVAVMGSKGKAVYPDGTLKDILRQDWGYWESKDEFDDLDLEIQKKFDKGYPQDNILFEDGITAILFQSGIQVSRVSFAEAAALDSILKSFIGFQRPEVAQFRKAIELFRADVPKVTAALREIIETSAEQKSAYIIKRDAFLSLCRDVINPAITKEDIREMVIQHILTADIFNTIFDEPNFHRENNIACELQSLVSTFFTREIRETTLSGIKHYYDTINARAAQIADHHEKQKFLKVVYETFYKSYSPKKADRLGVVYTPNEIVRFMIDSTDYLLGKHFGKHLEDRGVDILDPATGTGTFICDLIDHIRKDRLPYKYKNELHANEVEILPYYIANLNIEFTYKQKTGQYAEFANLCFVDTLDNMGFDYKDKQDDIFSLSDENSERIKKQNEKKISVIIGNPPYNANQMNENENNKNREYSVIDQRIKDTYIKYSTAQKTKVYDMYARFYRWAMDRIDGKGVICFITNNSYINSRTFDGFRKVVQDEFQYAYIINLGGNIRELSGKDGIFLGEKHTMFGLAAMVGISIMWLVKDETAEHKQCQIYYIHPTDIRATRDEKIEYLMSHRIKDIPFEHVHPDKDHNWINLTANDWDEMIAVADNDVKLGQSNKAIFRMFSNGVVTARDEWVYDLSEINLLNKTHYFVITYNSMLANGNTYENTVKWSETLKRNFDANKQLRHSKELIVESIYRPYYVQLYYAEKSMSDRLTHLHYATYGDLLKVVNSVIMISGTSSSKPFSTLSTSYLPNLDILEKTQYLPIHCYDKDGNRHDNITDWALAEFRKQYADDTITKEDIFQYVYGVLHHPAYRTKYEQNLKRSLPRIPYYKDFWQWAQWGRQLMALHIGFEAAEPYPLDICTHTVVAHASSRVVPDQAPSGLAGSCDAHQANNVSNGLSDHANANIDTTDKDIDKESGVQTGRDGAASGTTRLEACATRQTQGSATTGRDGAASGTTRLEACATVSPQMDISATGNTHWQSVRCGDWQSPTQSHSITTTLEQDRHPALHSIPKPKLKADKELGMIYLDEITTLKGIPSIAWEYKLGNRSALEWILDQYKEKKPKGPTIARLFNTYRFADYKDKVIDLLLRVTTVSVETMKIVREMEFT
jgi:predicted helicase